MDQADARLTIERCSDCNREWLNGYAECRHCGLPLLVPARELGIGGCEPPLGSVTETARDVAEELAHRWSRRLAGGWRALFSGETAARPAEG